MCVNNSIQSLLMWGQLLLCQPHYNHNDFLVLHYVLHLLVEVFLPSLATHHHHPKISLKTNIFQLFYLFRMVACVNYNNFTQINMSFFILCVCVCAVLCSGTICLFGFSSHLQKERERQRARERSKLVITIDMIKFRLHNTCKLISSLIVLAHIPSILY